MTRRVREVVTWTVQRRRGVKGALSWSWDVAGALVYVRAFEWTKHPEDPVCPADPGKQLKLDPAFIRGHAPWMPPEWAGPREIVVTGEVATTTSHALHTAPQILPLHELELITAHGPDRPWFPKCATAEWELVLSHGNDVVWISGPWLTLAWLGLLGCWAAGRSPS